MTDLHTAARQAQQALEDVCERLAFVCGEKDASAPSAVGRAKAAALRTALEAQQEPVTAREVAQQVFALCEHIESLPESPADSFALERFSAGQRFAAKQIRRGIGTWLTDEENVRGAFPQPTKVEAQQKPVALMWQHEETGRVTFTSMDDPYPGKRWHRVPLYAATQPAHPPAQPQGWVLVPACLLQKAADVLEEATTYTHSESWSPSMTDELLALRQAMLAARPQPKETT